MTCRKILCYKETLQFPPEAALTPEAEHLVRALLSNAARACPTWRRTPDDPTATRLQVRALLCDREGRLGHTSTEEIKAHPFFAGVDWPSLRTQRAPYADGTRLGRHGARCSLTSHPRFHPSPQVQAARRVDHGHLQLRLLR